MHPTPTMPRGANWLCSNSLERYAGPHRAVQTTGGRLALLCLLMSQTVFTPSHARGQTAGTYAPYFRPAAVGQVRTARESAEDVQRENQRTRPTLSVEEVRKSLSKLADSIYIPPPAPAGPDSIRLAALVDTDLAQDNPDRHISVEPALQATPDDGNNVRTTHAKAPSTTTFRRSKRGRLVRPKSFVPRSQPTNPPQVPKIPSRVAIRQPTRVERRITPRPLPTLADPVSAESAEPRPIAVHGEISLASPITRTSLAGFVDAPASPTPDRPGSADSELDEAALSALATMVRIPTAVQQPAATDSPSDLRPVPTPAAEAPQSPAAELTPAASPEIAAEVVTPQPTAELSRPIETLGADIDAPEGAFPKDVAAGKFAAAGEMRHAMGARRRDAETVIFWEAPAIAHRPLYFEDVNLERHGRKVPLIQPALSAAHFFGRVPALPYLMVSERHRQPRYPLGHYRPGSQAPYEWYLPRPSLGGGVVEAAAVTGLLFAFP